MAHFLRIDMSGLKTNMMEASDEYLLWAGRGLIAKIINNEVPPTCDPWGKYNKLVIAPGFFSGTGATSSSRISVGGKSPLTGGIKEANAGGVVAHKLGRVGVKAIIIEGQPKKRSLYLLKINSKGTELIEANHLAGLGNYALVEKLKKQFGKEVGILSIGKAGEMRFANSTVAVTDLEGRPCRHAARGGLGSVMGSKGVKAIVIDDANTTKLTAKDEKSFQETVRQHAKMLLEDKGPILRLKNYGIAGAVNMIHEMGALPTRNFRAGNFEGVKKITGEKMAELREIRGGKMHACSPTCVVGCSPTFLNENGEFVTSAFEYESLAMLGSNLGIDDIDAIAEMDGLCDDFGLDTIETGGTLAVAVEAGLMDFGDSHKAKTLIKEMGEATLLGRILSQGAAITARVLGVSRVAAVKGQALSAHEPRVFKGTGVTLATSPMGADHTAGMVLNPGISNDQAIELSRHVQILSALVDSTGCCQMLLGPLGASLTQRMLNGLYGLELTEKDVLEIGRAVLKEEEEFNRAAGITEAHNRLPEFFLEEVLPPNNATFDLSEKQLSEIFNNLDSPVVIPKVWEEMVKALISRGKK